MVVLGRLGRESTRFRDAGDRCGMADFLRHPLSLAALWFAVIFALTALAFKMVRRFGGSSAGDQPETAELLTKFRDLHSRGGLSDEEYRTIKTKLAAQLEVPLNDAEQSS